MKAKSLFILAILPMLALMIIACTEDPPTAPGRTNPLDEQNPQTHGDPFNLQAEIYGGGVRLTWQTVNVGSVVGYNIHRKMDDGAFALKYQLDGKFASSYVDTAIQNGHRYSYYIRTRNWGGQESTSNTAVVEIYNTPLLSIDDQNGYAPTRQVNLTLLAYGAVKMQVGTPDLSGALWVNYAASKTIQLELGAGTKVVKARFAYANGDTSVIVSDQTLPQPMNPTFNINNNAQYTSTRQVILYSTVASSNLKVKYSENSSFSGVNWQNFSPTAPFTLSTGSGIKTIYVRFQNDFEIDTTLSDQIQPQPMNPDFNVSHNAQYTSTRQVWLFPSATGANLKCKFSENNQFPGVNWVNYADSVSFTLTTGVGTKKVFCKIKNDFEIESTVLSKQIQPQPMNPSFNINNNAVETELRQVTLYLSAQGSNLKYMASENSSFIGATWQNYAAQAGFTLSSVAGTKTVYVKFKNDFEIESSAPSKAISYVYCFAPSNLIASATTTTSITLNWQDNSNVESGFKIERRIGATGSFAQIAIVDQNIRSYQNTGLNENTTYYYRVRAYNSMGNSEYSDTTNATTSQSIPNAPSNLQAIVISTSQINLSWHDNSNNETGFKIEQRTGTSGSFTQIGTVGQNVRSFQNTGLNENTTYCYRIRAYNSAGNSGYSNTASATTLYAGFTQTFPLGTTGLTIDMVCIPSGSFMQGAYSGEVGASPSEYPQHLVTLDYGFWLGKYEVTQAQWEAIAGSWSFYFDGHPDYPAESVSWNDITNTFLQTINSQTGSNVWRLPSESEWEYACRAGTTTRYYWGDDPSYTQIGTYAWYGSNSGNTTHTVGTRQPNAWGLYDMSGNVWEWCEDCWHSNYTGAPTNGDPWLSSSSSYRVLRGGSWIDDGDFCRSAYRGSYYPSDRGNYYGFRLVRSS